MADDYTQEVGDDERVSRLSASTPIRDTEMRPYRGSQTTASRGKPRSYSTLYVSDEERVWAAVAHGCVWVTLITGVLTGGLVVPLSIFIPLVIYFLFRQRSDYVAFHALQAFVIQLAGTVGVLALLIVGGVIWVIGMIIAALLVVVAVGIILVPVWGIVGVVFLLVVALVFPATLLYGTIAAIETYHGRDFRYPFIANWVDRQMAGGYLSVV